jgi:UDP-N-acetylmuramoyl-L-alanyl-D-glutamate--2,6-diaminopimelate ligase
VVFGENALAALAAALAAGVPASAGAAVRASAAPPEGRFEVVRVQPYVVIDYAHTPDALSRTLATARRLCAGTLTLVFGSGGNGDKTERHLLGLAARAADRIVVTSDNPRYEDPDAIIAEVTTAIGDHSGLVCEVDRQRAIQLALSDARPEDWVLIAGKGHERHQESAGVKSPFSDRDVPFAAQSTASRGR